MTDQRAFLPIGTTVELDNDVYQIIGEPIGCGGGSILYPAQKQFMLNGLLQTDGIRYVLKECYPAASSYSYTRADNGEIIPVYKNTEDMLYLQQAQLMQLEEKTVSQNIYRTASRMLPIRSCAQSVVLTLPGKEGPAIVPNTMTLMDSLAEKGQALTEWIRQKRRFAPAEAFRIIQQVLFALQEVHEAGYLHLDIQDGNIFFRGSLEQKNEMATLIDFGCARKLINGKTEPIRDKVIFTTHGFSAPEILLHNDGNLQLGPEADLYSVGCLALYLLTGQRANIRELIANRTGIYLRSNQLRRIQCPKHLIGTMQHVLARALAKETENRYHSVKDMLDEVTPLTEALQPKSTILGAVKYDAFVCYKHGSVDSVAALTLQRALENYRAPKGVADKRRPFGRVFVDEGELSSCADFGQQIRDALKNSEWLIVICSPDTPSSPWVQLEIDTFQEYHDRSRILAVLTGGNPEISFPPQLKGDINGVGEVFAAHAISSTLQEAEKQLKGDAVLKIAAPMLNTTFDTLKQRQKIYRLQRIAAITAGFLLASVGFAAYAMNRAKVIAEQAARIEEEHKQSQLNESQLHIEQAEKKLEENDTTGAVELLLPILTAEEQDRSVLTNAEFLLGKILGIYETPATALQTAAPAGLADTDCRAFFPDPAGEYLFAWDGTENTVEVWSAKNLRLIRKLSPDDTIMYTSEELLASDQHTLIVKTAGTIICFDYLNGNKMWEMPADNAKSLYLAKEQKQLIILRSELRSQSLCAEILSAATGNLLTQIPFQLKENHHISFFEQMRTSPDGNWLVFTAEGELPEEENAYRDTLYLLNLETGACNLLTDTGTAINTIEILKDRIVVMRWSGNAYASQCSMLLEAYDCSTQKQNWHMEQEFYPKTAGGDQIKLIPAHAGTYGKDSILFSFADKCFLIDWETGTVIRQYEIQAPIAEVICYTSDGFNVLGSDGSFTLASYDHDELLTIPFINCAINSAVSRNGKDFYIQCSSDSSQDYRIRKFTWGKCDAAYVPLYEAEDMEWYLGEIYTDGERASAIRLEQNGKIRYIDLDADIVRDYAIPEEYAFSGGVSSDGETVYWSGGNWYDALDSVPYYMLDLKSGEIQELVRPKEFDEMIFFVDMLFCDNNILFAAEQDTEKQDMICVYCWNPTEDSFTRKYCNTFDLPKARIKFRSFSGNFNEGYVYFVVENDKYIPTSFVQIDIVTNEAKVITLGFFTEEPSGTVTDNMCYQWNYTGNKLVFGYQKHIYIVDDTGSLLWTDAADNEIVQTIFSPDEQYVYVFEDIGTISKYRAADGTCTDCLSLRDYCTADGFIRGNLYLSCNALYWTFIDESELLVYDDSNGGFLLDISNETLLMKAVLPKCCGYDPETDQFFVTDMNYISGEISSIGAFRHYSTDDLVKKANAVLNN